MSIKFPSIYPHTHPPTYYPSNSHLQRTLSSNSHNCLVLWTLLFVFGIVSVFRVVLVSGHCVQQISFLPSTHPYIQPAIHSYSHLSIHSSNTNYVTLSVLWLPSQIKASAQTSRNWLMPNQSSVLLLRYNHTAMYTTRLNHLACIFFAILPAATKWHDTTPSLSIRSVPSLVCLISALGDGNSATCPKWKAALAYLQLRKSHMLLTVLSGLLQLMIRNSWRDFLSHFPCRHHLLDYPAAKSALTDISSHQFNTFSHVCPERNHLALRLQSFESFELFLQVEA